MIRNPRAALTAAVKALHAGHRLLLSGTPIQNNVLEMWSLLDFLMPGFLGPEKAFNAKFGKAVQVGGTVYPPPHPTPPQPPRGVCMRFVYDVLLWKVLPRVLPPVRSR